MTSLQEWTVVVMQIALIKNNFYWSCRFLLIIGEDLYWHILIIFKQPMYMFKLCRQSLILKNYHLLFKKCMINIFQCKPT